MVLQINHHIREIGMPPQKAEDGQDEDVQQFMPLPPVVARVLYTAEYRG
jgi:hypothetical protein